MRRLFFLLSLVMLSGCGGARAPEPPVSSGSSTALWGQQANGPRWTKSALVALDGPASALVRTVPADIATYCPAYRNADEAARKAFWVTFLSALAKHESTWREDVSGGGGQWHGLLQISPATARGYGCQAKTAADLKEGSANLSCGLRIMSQTVTRDGVISAGLRGVAADWGPFHQAGKRADIQATTQRARACQG